MLLIATQSPNLLCKIVRERKYEFFQYDRDILIKSSILSINEIISYVRNYGIENIPQTVKAWTKVE